MVDVGPYSELIVRCEELKEITASMGKIEEAQQEEEKARPEIPMGKTVRDLTVSAPVDPEKSQRAEVSHENAAALEKKKLIREEDRAQGLIGADIYFYYMRKGGFVFFFTMIGFFFLSTAFGVTSGSFFSFSHFKSSKFPNFCFSFQPGGCPSGLQVYMTPATPIMDTPPLIVSSFFSSLFLETVDAHFVLFRRRVDLCRTHFGTSSRRYFCLLYFCSIHNTSLSKSSRR